MIFNPDCSEKGNMIWVEEPQGVHPGVANCFFGTTNRTRMLINPRNINYIVANEENTECVDIVMVGNVIISCPKSSIEQYLEIDAMDFCQGW